MAAPHSKRRISRSPTSIVIAAGPAIAIVSVHLGRLCPRRPRAHHHHHSPLFDPATAQIHTVSSSFMRPSQVANAFRMRPLPDGLRTLVTRKTTDEARQVVLSLLREHKALSNQELYKLISPASQTSSDNPGSPIESMRCVWVYLITSFLLTSVRLPSSPFFLSLLRLSFPL